ncbi:hypothetical protein SELMODRAFT_424457 [Selaginella moellendorffii]|uniref:Uncharacterized protein n=1 Tax=Selaginella moellendorffii TaxID=88036 RepID=D8SPY4_SELML|nr:hypothetical protein SELMODRAFT_424457 [Selaginella moellendorffii]
MHAQEHCGADDGRHLLEGLVTNVFVVLSTAMEHKRGGIQITGIIKSLKAPGNVIKMLQRNLPVHKTAVSHKKPRRVMDDLATVVDSKHAITFAHEGHSVWQVGHVFTFRHPFKQTVQEVPVILEVEALFRNSDLILLRRMYGEFHKYPVLEIPQQGMEYFLLGCRHGLVAVRHGVVSEDSEEASSIRTNGFLMVDLSRVKVVVDSSKPTVEL